MPSISSYRVAANGNLTLAGSTPFAGDAGAAKVSAFRIHGTSLTEIAGSPIAIPGGAAPFGMVVD